MAYFHLRLVPPRPTFPHDATEPEMKAMDRHADYWRERATAGTAIAAGPVFEGEGAWGMALVEVENADAALLLADADPVILADIGFRYDIAPVPTLILRS
ncbi:YciI family protein [Rhizobium sp. GN54]|uniref:YciI family protein n=1 Tax=Rhizobium sp. GN54 TaxID=2898150 RepID=UPI001E3C41FF|nr:YciI family protein [Rhizobium sp. GN54]MCD2182394.1 YciI family protein [Rhizobium sp. GN54]